jgi:uncharacterized protein with LGFP repeats
MRPCGSRVPVVALAAGVAAVLAYPVAARVPLVVRPVVASAYLAAPVPVVPPVKPRAETVSLAVSAGAGSDIREALPRSPFSLVGFVWPGEKPDLVEMRSRSDRGVWSAWEAVEAMDAGPNGGGAPKASEPIWTGPATGVQARAFRAGRSATEDLSVVLVDPGASVNDSRIKAVALSGVPSMPTVITRAQWGADESMMTWPPEYSTTVKAASIHHTADSNDYTCDQSASLVRGIYYYHAVTNGWGDIGYNALVDKCGTIFEGRTGGLNVPTLGAHTGGFNQSVFGLAMIGDYDAVSPSAATLDSVARMIAWKLGNGYVDPAGMVTLTSAGGGTSKYSAGTVVALPVIFGHRDTGKTVCPGAAGYAQLPWVRDRVGQLAGDWRASPVYQKWLALGGENGLGPVSAVEADWPDGGRATDFGGGNATIAWRGDVGAHAIMGAIRANFAFHGGQPVLGYPTTDETRTPDGIGRFNHFTRDASIYWTPDTGAHAVADAIRDRWAALGWETGRLGYPTTDQTPTPDLLGRYNHFSRDGSIYWTSGTGAHAVYGAIRSVWAVGGWETGRLGYPATDETGTPDGVGRFNHFSGAGSVYWTPGTGAHTIFSVIRDRWAALGWETGRLGYPTTDETVTPDGAGRFNHFSRDGSIYWTPGTGAHAVYGAIRDRWRTLGWENSWLGYPVSDEYGVTDGRRGDFQGGYILWNAATGVAAAYRY